MSTTDPGPEFDWVVVGGGAAGCVLASRLSEDPDVSVLLLEAGPPATGEDVADPRRWTSLLGGRLDWGWSYEPGEAVLGRRIPIPRGRVLGGSSSTNALLWYRGAPAEYDAWAAAGATGWDWAAMLLRFRRSEDFAGGASDWRGAGGPMRVTTPPDPHPVASAVLDGAPAVGIPRIADCNGPEPEGAALANLNAAPGPDGLLRRWSTVRGYLDPAADRPNLTVRTGATALRVLLDGHRAVAVEHVAEGEPEVVRAARGIVLTLGAIATPVLLQRSGIGDPARLAAAGVRPLHALPGVGEGFADHPLVAGVNASTDRPLGAFRDNGGGAVMNWRSSLAGATPDLHALVVQEERPVAGQDLGPHAFAVSPGLLRSASRGHVRIRSGDPAVPPEVQPNLLAETGDVERLVEGVERVLDLFATPAFRALGARPALRFPPGDRKGVERFVRRAAGTFFHCSGSTRMGTDDGAVVGPDLRVRGLEGLVVADASVFPRIPAATTHWPTIAVAECAADLLRGGAL